MKPPTLIAGTSVRTYVLALLREDVARRDALVRVADANIKPHALADPRKVRAQFGSATRLRNEAQRAREILDFFRTKFTVDDR